jgi:platelet-activating factor acetylhydrolase
VVELPSVDGPYNVGVLDFYLPVQDQLSDDKRGHDNTPFSPHISVRLLYPTLDKPNGIPYLNPLVAKEYCRELMRFGAPLPLKKHDWFLHTWRLMRLRVRSRAQLIEQPEKLPLVFFSHGLGGTSEIYSYQTMALASNGHLVVSINHEDGSAPAVKKYNGSLLTYNHDLAASWMNNDHGAYVRKRRAQTDHRATEFISAVEAFLQLNDQDNNDLSQAGIALRNRLDKEQCTFMGHSFGGATALVAANRRTDLVKRVIAHEPAIDWMTDDARRSLFAEYVIKDLSHSYVGGTGGYETSHDEEDGPSVHDLDLLLLYSNEWVDKRWGESHIVADVFRSGRLGQRGGASRFEMIQDSHHMEFSDVSLITPPWLAGGTKKRTSHEIAIEISRMTSRWIDRSRLTT